MNIIEEIGNFEHVTCNIVHDDYAPESPREWCNLGTFWMWCRNYASPDELPNRRWDMEDCFASEFSLKDISETKFYDTGDQGSYRDYIMEQVEKLAIILPVYKYEHGGVVFNTEGFSCPWDSGQVGFIFVSLEDVRKEYGVKRVTKAIREKVIEQLKGEVKTYSQWVNSEVYGFEIIDNETGDTLEYCYGFIGDSDDEHLVSEALSSAMFENNLIKQQKHKSFALQLEASRPDMYSHV